MAPKLSCVLIVEAAHKMWLFWKDRAGQACLTSTEKLYAGGGI